jgi:hypothetical protein
VISGTFTEMLKDFELYLLRNRDFFIKKLDSNNISATPAEVTQLKENINTARTWQSKRPEYFGKFRLSPMFGYALDFSNPFDFSRLTAYENGFSFGLEFATNPLLLPTGQIIGPSGFFTPELWSRISFLKTTYKLYDSNTLVSEDNGGESHYGLSIGFRPMISPMQTYHLFVQGGVGITWGSQEGDVVPKTPSDYPGTDYFIHRYNVTFTTQQYYLVGGGIRLGHRRDKLNYEVNVNYSNVFDGDRPVLDILSALRIQF